jgi:hypothetical protein
MKKPSDIKDFIDCLGGTYHAASIYDVGPSAVSNWIARDRIPPLRYVDTLKIAKRRHIEVRLAWFKKKVGK